MRNNVVSISKGICIILMVYGHSGCSEVMHNFIYAFHMPLFFFLSGYCFKTKYTQEPFTFVKNKMIGIWWPYVKWVSIFVILHNFFIKIGVFYEGFVFRNSTMNYYSIRDIFIHLVNTLRFCHGELLLAGFWFLFTLFMASIMFIILIKYIHNNILIITFSFLAMITFNYFDYTLPLFHIGDKEFQALFFISIGYAFKNVAIINRYFINLGNNFLYIICLFISVFIGSQYYPSEMISLKFNTIIQYTIIAVIGSMFIYSFASRIAKNKYCSKLLTFVGDNTLTILVWHFSMFKVVSLILILLYGKDISELSCFPTISSLSLNGWNIVYTIFAVIGSLVINRIQINNIKQWNIFIR